MDVNTLQTLITTLGFPIVCTIALGFFIYKVWGSMEQTNKEREDKLYELIGKCQVQNDELSKTNAEFVAVLQSYKDDLDCIKTDVIEIKQRMDK